MSFDDLVRQAGDRLASGAMTRRALIAGPDSMREMDWGRAVPAWGVDDAPALDVVHVDGAGEQR